MPNPRRLFPPFLFIFIVLFVPFVSAAGIFYVSPDGSDSSPGTLAQPWRTLQKASSSVGPGDTVYLRNGTWQERLMPQVSGSDGAPITFAAYPGDTATLDGTGFTFDTDSGLVDLSGRSHIRISGLRIVNSPGAGIYADGASSLVIERCRTDTTQGSGIGIWGSSDVVVDGNEIVAACISGWQEHITIAGTDRFEVKNNEIHGTASGNGGKEGICLKDGSSNGSAHHNHVYDLQRVGIYVDAWNKHTYNISVYSNRVHNIAANAIATASESGGLLENVRVENNLAYDSDLVGIWVSGCCAAGAPHHPMKDIVVINNTCVRNGSPWGGGIAVENSEIEGVVIRNNLLSDNLTFQLAADSSQPSARLAIDHNLIDGFRATEGEVRGSDPIEGDPRLRDTRNGDFHIMTGSAAIDTGSAAAAPESDFDGNRRPLDGDGDKIAAYDVGAFESTAFRMRSRPVRR